MLLKFDYFLISHGHQNIILKMKHNEILKENSKLIFQI